MGVREDMEEMMNGNFTEKVMSPEDREALINTKEPQGAADNSSQQGNNEIGNQSNDNSQESSSTETGGEITGLDEGKQVPTGTEDTTATQSSGSNVDTDVDGVAQSQENAGNQSNEDAGNTQLDESGNSQNGSQADEAGEQDGEINYKQKYEELQKSYESTKAFQDKVTADFKANGKMVKGIDDPEKIVKNLQMSTGLAKKVSEYKKAKPFIEPMEKRGLMQNPDKFDMHMKMEDGDTDAIKQFLKDKGIDPMDLDFEEDFSYKVDSTRIGKEEMIFADMQETADSYGVADKFTSTVLEEWDPESAGKLFDGEQGLTMANQLAAQMANGVYDKVSAIAENMKLTQPGFMGLSSIDQYNEASKVYNSTVTPATTTPQAVVQNNQEPQVQESAEQMRERIRAEVEAEINAKAAEEYKKKVENENRRLEEERNNAAQFSQNHSANNAATETKPMTLAEKREEWNRLRML